MFLGASVQYSRGHGGVDEGSRGGEGTERDSGRILDVVDGTCGRGGGVVFA